MLIDRRAFLLAPLALAADRPQNILLITATGWRGQATPWDGDHDLAAPNLEKFGKQSVVFSRTYCASPKPDLAQTALLTAKYPHAAKTDDEVLGRLKKLTPEAAQKAFEKTPFAVHVPLTSLGGPGRGLLHLRGNIPSENELQARSDVGNFYGGCSNNDSVLGEILGALEERNLTGDTVVCFSSDCGQQLGSQGLNGAGFPFEESVRIPLAIRYPRKLKPDARDLASQVDVMPTLLTLCGADIPEGVQGVDLFGKMPPEVAFSEGKLGQEDEWRMLVRGYDKLVATPKGSITHLFNLADDPYEMMNLANDPAQKLKLASLKAQLQAQMRKLSDGVDPSGLRKR